MLQLSCNAARLELFSPENDGRGNKLEGKKNDENLRDGKRLLGDSNI